MKQKILLIEDDNCSRLGVVRSLSEKGYAVSVASNHSNAEEDVLARRFDAVILGINSADGKGPGFIEGIRVYDPHLPIVVITGCDQIEIAVDAVRCGADNVLAKPVDLAALSSTLGFLLGEGSFGARPALRHPPQQAGREEFFRTGPAAGRFPDLAAGAAAGSASLLITGETGTGKGLLARWVHQNGSRSSLPFAGVNCSGLRGEILEAELFGTPCGAGGGCARRPPGLVEQAGGGTLFLDEVGDMSLPVQAGLLAALQARLHPPGNGEPSGAGFRLICSSNQRLDDQARAGTFLPGLLSLISGTVLRIPPLRERLTELSCIVRHLLDGLRGPDAEITDPALRELKRYRWPGNLRELKNALERGLILSHGARLGPEHFDWLKPASRTREARPLLTMSEMKEQHIAAALKQANGEAGYLAASLGISRATMYRRLKQLRDNSY